MNISVEKEESHSKADAYMFCVKSQKMYIKSWDSAEKKVLGTAYSQCPQFETCDRDFRFLLYS